MRPINQDVFDLIKVMTSGEKRYFNLHYGHRQNQMTYLYNILDDLETYNEAKVKERFIKKSDDKYFKIVKQKLFNLLLDSLRAYRSENRLQNRLLKEIEEGQILSVKGLFKPALRKFKKVREKADLNGLVTIKFLALNSELTSHLHHAILLDRAASRAILANANEPKPSIYTGLQSTSQALVDLSKYNTLRFEVAQLASKKIGKKERAVVNDLLDKHPALKANAASISLRLLQKGILSTCYFILGEHEKAAICLTTQIAEMESLPDFLDLFAYTYISNLRNLIIASIALHRYEMVVEIIPKMEKAVQENQHLNPILLKAYFFYIFSLIKRGLVQRCLIESNHIFNYIEINNLKQKKVSYDIYLLFGFANFIQKDYETAQAFYDKAFEKESLPLAYFGFVSPLFKLLNLYCMKKTTHVKRYIHVLKTTHADWASHLFFEDFLTLMIQMSDLTVPDQKKILESFKKNLRSEKYTEDLTYAGFVRFNLEEYLCVKFL